MTSALGRFEPVRISTADIPERDRVAVWRDVIGRKIVRVDIEPLPDCPFHVSANLRGLPGLGLMSADMSAFRLTRSPELLADGNDDVRLAVNLSGAETVGQRGRETVLQPGDAALVSMAETGHIVRHTPGRRLGFNVPRHILAPLVSNIDTAPMRPIPRNAPELRLLLGYLGVLNDPDMLATAELRQAVASHIHDLIALLLGATADAKALAEGRGARAARLQAIKTDIAANIGRSDLTIDVIARRHRLGTRYIQRLFESDGTTFSEFVAGQRLARAHRMLTDPHWAARTIGDIAEACGFSDLTHFGRRFRRRYGVTASDLRALSRGTH